MDIDFRNRVLDMSLTIEDFLSRLLFMQFRISKEESKTLSYKSSALSFKNKADLLHDLNKISDETYKHLQCFMEIRNQFIHNLSTANIIIAAERVKKLNFLISLSEQAKNSYNSNLPDEIKIIGVEMSFLNLYGLIINSFNPILDSIKVGIDNEIESEGNKREIDIAREVLELLGESIDFVSEKFDETMMRDSNSENNGLIKNAIITHFAGAINKKYKV